MHDPMLALRRRLLRGRRRRLRQTGGATDPRMTAWLDSALDVIQQNALRRAHFDSTRVRRGTHDRAAGAGTTVDTLRSGRAGERVPTCRVNR
ncbi:MAG: hypothetical protein L0271_00685 [Gemmatimonadetes bacterium]|nr:hypothetical protein [Gemmatimonadota bacterium]